MENTAKLISREEIIEIITASVLWRAVKRTTMRKQHSPEGIVLVPTNKFHWYAEVTVNGERNFGGANYFLTIDETATTRKALAERVAERIAEIAKYVDEHQPYPTRYGGAYKISADYPLHGTDGARAEFNQLLAMFKPTNTTGGN